MRHHPLRRGLFEPARPPWWLVVAAAAFIGYFVLIVRADLDRPESMGFDYRFDSSGMTVAAVTPDSPAGRAGLRSGDRIAGAGLRPIVNRLDWLVVAVNHGHTEPLGLDVARGSERLAAALALEPVSPGYWATISGATLAIGRSVQLVTLAVALIVAFTRPADRFARLAAWLLATMAVFSFTWPYDFARAWRELPHVLGIVMWLPFASTLAVAPILCTVFARFPYRFVRAPVVWAVLWMPALVVLVPQLQQAVAMVYWPAQASFARDWTTAATAVTAAYVVAAAALLVAGYRRITDLTLRRRVRVLAVGSCVGMTGALPVLILYNRPQAILGSSLFESPVIVLSFFVGLALPLSFAYAALRHRLFDVSFIVRRSLQYALTRRVLMSAVPLAAAAFAADLWLNRDTPLEDVLGARGWLYAGLAGLALVAGTQRRQWLERLDRRFFRERYNAQRVLRSIAEGVRHAPTLEAAAALIVTRIEEALHPERVALLTRRPTATRFDALAAAPAGLTVAPLPAMSAIAALLPPLRRPVEVSERAGSWMLDQLPPDDVEWLARERIDMLVPVRFGSRATDAFFALGPRLSEEPYSQEDQDLLMAVAHGLAMLLGDDREPAPAAEALEECPACGRCCDPGTGCCPDDGTTLAAVGLPRVLGGRYALTRRIGVGGTGTVYLATDTALDRPVAIKVLRQDLVDPTAAARFQSEARLGASLVHRHVVSIYDVGTTRAGRTFLVMERLEGCTVREELGRVGCFAPERALPVLRGVAAAIDAAHARQLVHRDLKPENIFLCRSDDGDLPKVLDFGLAKAFAASEGSAPTRPGIVAGTPEYMAPEHLAGGDASPDWDLWALAVVAFEILAGSRPFSGRPDAAPRLERLPPACRPVFARALAIDPLDRPTSAGEIVRDLQTALTT